MRKELDRTDYGKRVLERDTEVQMQKAIGQEVTKNPELGKEIQQHEEEIEHIRKRHREEVGGAAGGQSGSAGSGLPAQGRPPVHTTPVSGSSRDPAASGSSHPRGSKRVPEVPTDELQDQGEGAEPERGVKREAEVDIRDIDDRVDPPAGGAMIGHWGKCDANKRGDLLENIMQLDNNKLRESEVELNKVRPELIKGRSPTWRTTGREGGQRILAELGKRYRHQQHEDEYYIHDGSSDNRDEWTTTLQTLRAAAGEKNIVVEQFLTNCPAIVEELRKGTRSVASLE